ncbi:hypothetical protein JXA80_11595 [bacterium]|nr:hypothetical protein [candidate division CSSED10-310 bacterium]
MPNEQESSVKTMVRWVSQTSRQAHREAEKIIEMARENANRIIEDAHRQSKAIHAETKRKAMLECRKKMADRILEIHAYCTRLEQSVKHEILELVIRTAEAVLFEAVAVDPSIVMARIERGLELNRRQRSVRLFVSPETARQLTPRIKAVSREILLDTLLTVESDPSLKNGDCRFVTPAGTISMTISEGFRIVRKILSQTIEEWKGDLQDENNTRA